MDARRVRHGCGRWLVAVALAGATLFLNLTELALAGAASSGPVAGMAKVVDGDTIEVAGVRVRLEGIDAPEAAQSCTRHDGGEWSCGQASASALSRMLGKRRVTCEDRGHDIYRRMIGVCRVDGQDINAAMVRQGWAWAFVKYSRTYVQEEALARADRVGIWQGDAQPAWTFREQRWASAEPIAPNGCSIKGNVSRNGQIYHMPWSPWYAKVRIEPAKGARWFCTEAEAQAAGWRPALTR